MEEVRIVSVNKAMKIAENEESVKISTHLAKAAGMAASTARPVEVWLGTEVIIVVPEGTTTEEVVGRVSLAPLPEDVLRI